VGGAAGSVTTGGAAGAGLSPTTRYAIGEEDVTTYYAIGEEDGSILS
jgi:hypothetical protein